MHTLLRKHEFVPLIKEILSRHKTITFSSFGKSNENFSFITDRIFEHILVVLFKSKYLCTNSTTALCKKHKLFLHLYITMHTLCTHDFAPLNKTESNWSEPTVIPVQRKSIFSHVQYTTISVSLH